MIKIVPQPILLKLLNSGYLEQTDLTMLKVNNHNLRFSLATITMKGTSLSCMIPRAPLKKAVDHDFCKSIF